MTSILDINIERIKSFTTPCVRSRKEWNCCS